MKKTKIVRKKIFFSKIRGYAMKKEWNLELFNKYITLEGNK